MLSIVTALQPLGQQENILFQDFDAFELARSMFSQRSDAWAPIEDSNTSPHMCYGFCGDSGSL